MRLKLYHPARLLSRLWLACALVGIWASTATAQSYTENFNNPSQIFSSGWAQQNLSTPIGTLPGWFTGNGSVFPAYNAPDSSYIAANYNNVAGANTISNWLFTPNRTYQNGHTFSFWTRTVDAPTYPDRLEVRLSTNGNSVNVGSTNTSVGDFTTVLLTVNPTLTTTGYPNVWTQYTVTLSGLAGPTSGRIAFRYFVTNGGPSGANSDYIGIDNVQYTVPVSADAQMQDRDTIGYTIIPEDHLPTAAYTGTIRNNGTGSLTNVAMRVRVLDGTGTPVYNQVSASVASLAPSASSVFTVPAVGSLTVGDVYTVQYIAQHSVADANLANDTLEQAFIYDAAMYARDDASVVAALGIGAGNGGYLGQQYTLYQPDLVDSVMVFVTAGYTGEPMAAVFWDVVSGQPGSIIGSTDTIPYIDDSARTYMLPVSGGPLSLPAGDFVVTFVEFDSTVQLGQTNSIFLPGTTWVNWPTSPAGGWANNEFFGVAAFNRPYVIRPNLSLCPAYTANMSSTQSACGGATGTATVSVTGGPGPFTYMWSNGQTTSTANGLAAGNYTVTATDGSGCGVVGSVSVSNPNAPSINSVTPTAALCNGGTGSVTANVTGGTSPYTYAWSNGGSGSTITVPAGTYSVTVTDAAGCVVSGGPATVTQPTALSVNVSSTQESSPGANDGTATAAGQGGTSPFTYAWSNGGNTATVTGLGAGTYTVTVTDANGCTTTGSTSVIVGIDGGMNALEMGAYPNPNDGTFRVFVNTAEATDLNIEIVDMMGKVVFTAQALGSTEFRRDVTLNAAAGIYFLRVKAGEETMRTMRIEVKR